MRDRHYQDLRNPGGQAGLAGPILLLVSQVSAVPERFRPLLAALIDMIAAGDLAAIRADPRIRIRGSDPLLWARDYPGTVTALPSEGWHVADAIQLHADPAKWSVVVPLWTDREGPSDLSLEATIHDLPDGAVIILDNIHVR